MKKKCGNFCGNLIKREAVKINWPLTWLFVSDMSSLYLLRQFPSLGLHVTLQHRKHFLYFYLEGTADLNDFCCTSNFWLYKLNVGTRSPRWYLDSQSWNATRRASIVLSFVVKNFSQVKTSVPVRKWTVTIFRQAMTNHWPVIAS